MYIILPDQIDLAIWRMVTPASITSNSIHHPSPSYKFIFCRRSRGWERWKTRRLQSSCSISERMNKADSFQRGSSMWQPKGQAVGGESVCGGVGGRSTLFCRLCEWLAKGSSFVFVHYFPERVILIYATFEWETKACEMLSQFWHKICLGKIDEERCLFLT